jgi:hypothetical protein
MNTETTTLNSKGVDIHAASNKIIAAYIQNKEAEIAAFVAKTQAQEIELAEVKLALRTKKAEDKAKLQTLGIKLEEVARTYNGETGCACGCGGEYTNDGEKSATVTKRLNYVNKGIVEGRAEFFGNGVEVANASYTRCTRIYFVDGIRKDKAGN